MSEGRHEIEAAKKRLAAARATASSAATIMDSAKLMEQTACTMATTAKKNKAIAATLLKSSSKEVKEAKDILKKVEKKWNFVAVDADAGDSPKKNNGRKKKRRKVSASNASAETALEENNSGDDTGQNESAMAAARLENNIVVEGAGLAVINGTYKKLADHCYEKEGQWNGAIGIFMIFQKGTHWFFGFRGDGTPYCQQKLYRTMSSCSAEAPRKTGWMTIGGGVSPAPKLKW
jgi:hypothetical protein